MNAIPMRFCPVRLSEPHCRWRGGKAVWMIGWTRKEMVFGALDAQGRLCGVAGLSVGAREKEAHKATLFGMYVPSACRGQGIGAQLVQSVLDEARARQLRLVQLTVTQGNEAAERLYASQGFEIFGVEPMALRLGDAFFNKVHMWWHCDA